jgi:hypothetical protein
VHITLPSDTHYGRLPLQTQADNTQCILSRCTATVRCPISAADKHVSQSHILVWLSCCCCHSKLWDSCAVMHYMHTTSSSVAPVPHSSSHLKKKCKTTHMLATTIQQQQHSQLPPKEVSNLCEPFTQHHLLPTVQAFTDLPPQPITHMTQGLVRGHQHACNAATEKSPSAKVATACCSSAAVWFAAICDTSSTCSSSRTPRCIPYILPHQHIHRRPASHY